MPKRNYPSDDEAMEETKKPNLYEGVIPWLPPGESIPQEIIDDAKFESFLELSDAEKTVLFWKKTEEMRALATAMQESLKTAGHSLFNKRPCESAASQASQDGVPHPQDPGLDSDYHLDESVSSDDEEP